MDIEKIKEFLETEEGKQYIESHESVSGLRNKRDELLSQLTTIKGKLQSYSELGDIEEIKSAITKVSKVKESSKEDKDTTKEDAKVIAQIEHLTNELNNERNLRTKREQSMVKSFVNAEVTKLIAKHKGVPELLNHIIMSRVEASLDDAGNVVINTKTMDGQPYFKDGKEGTIEDVINDIKNNPVYGRAFEVEMPNGSGARPVSKGGRPTGDIFDPSTNLTEMMKKKAR